jgi:hypothetical protein
LRIFSEELEHPTQASRVRVNVFEMAAPPSGEPTPASAELRRPGYLVTEDREGVVRVIKTLGFDDTREAAMARARAHVRMLEAQRYRIIAPAA